MFSMFFFCENELIPIKFLYFLRSEGSLGVLYYHVEKKELNILKAQSNHLL